MTAKKEKVGIVYHPDYLIHTQSYHPERKERLEKIIAGLKDYRDLNLVEMIDPEPANLDDLALVHDRDYISAVEKACREGRQSLDMDTYLTDESYRVALLAAGGAIGGLRKVMGKEPARVFALVRPPGHHAEYNQAMGFCLFNNIAIAAAVASRDYNLNRIAIVDWDVHHGNGTQHSFEKESKFLFISAHQSPAYPGTGQVREVGTDEGEGYTINIPLPPGSGDPEYALAFREIIIPVLDQYKPELLLISAGQDAYHMDPLASMKLTLKGYYDMAIALADVADRWCGGRMLLSLEGGYHLEGQAGAVKSILNALGGWDFPVEEGGPELKPTDEALRVLDEVRSVQNRFWKL